MGQREEFIKEYLAGDPAEFGDGWTPEEVRAHKLLAWPFQSSYGVGLGERDARSAVRRAEEQAIVAAHVLGQVKEQAVFALLSEGYSIRETATALEIPKSEVGRIAKTLGGEPGKPESHATAGPLALRGAQSAVRDWIVDAWRAEPQYGAPRPVGADLRPALSAEATARLVLEALYGTTEPKAEDLAAAIAQVEHDPIGSQILALGGPIPRDRLDLRLARTRGTYVSSEATPAAPDA